MKLRENVPLADFTTFKIGGPARFFCLAESEADLIEAVSMAKKGNHRILVLGGGSNILISDAGFPGIVIKNDLKGRELREVSPGHYILTANAGELWDDIVSMAVEGGLYGIENLSAIPGNVGAAPVQNIGAYGTEVSDCITSVRALDTVAMKFVDLSPRDCHFSYRDSIFKRRKGRYIITCVDFRLTKDGKVNIEYADLKRYFSKDGVLTQPSPSLKEVREAVINIRWKKLPDWKLWGTAGSFFKNPVISILRYYRLKEKYPDLPSYPESFGRVKVPLAWILDNICNIKGQMDGNVGSYENQALVIVTKPGATASEVVNRAQKIMDMVMEKTGIKIEAEVEWVN